MNFKYLLLILVLGFTILTSCEKENVDVPTIVEEEVTTEELECDLTAVFITNLIEETLKVIVEGGTPPYAYLWSTGETTTTIPIPEGDYGIEVIDSEGCTIDGGVSVVDLCESLAIEVLENPENTLTVNATGGTEPYLYNWSTGETTNSITVTTSGDYEVNAIDANGCVVSVTTPIIVSNPCESFEIEVMEEPAGTLTVNVSGGIAPYTYDWSNGANTSSISVTASGDYEVNVIDSQGCVISVTTTVTVSDFCGSFVMELIESSPGTLTANVSGGAPPYIYDWSTGENTSSITVSMSGQYEVQAIDANGCIVSNTIIYTATDPCQNMPIVIVHDLDSTNMTLTVTVTGGTEPYLYLWSTGETTESISVVSGGVYTIEVIDMNGCTATTVIQVP